MKQKVRKIIKDTKQEAETNKLNVRLSQPKDGSQKLNTRSKMLQAKIRLQDAGNEKLNMLCW